MATKESTPVKLAKESLAYYLTQHEMMPLPEELSTALTEQAGVFVSLKKQGQLRGCIGTFLPTKENIALEIMYNAVYAGTQDPRFSPVQLAELEDVDISVDILSKPEKVAGPEELDSTRYGIIVKHKGRTGLLLPALEGVDSVEQQIDIARQKAGIKPDEPIELYRFQVTRYR